MGRQIKRVSIGFHWPLGRVWSGYLNPHGDERKTCPDCMGSAYSPQATAMHDRWYGNAPFVPQERGSEPFLASEPAIWALAQRNVRANEKYYGSGEVAIDTEARRLADHFNSQWCHHLNADDVAALVADHRLMEFTHVRVPGAGWQPRDPVPELDVREVNRANLEGMGLCSLDAYVVIRAECARRELPLTCATCDGTGRVWESAQAQARADAWRSEEPPAGDGWQVWENVSEGAPVTPVFASEDALVDYLVQQGDWLDRQRGRGGWSREAARTLTSVGCAPTLLQTASGLHEPRDGLPVV